jgi:hypothetical protein
MPKSNDPRTTGRPSDEAIAKRAYELYLQRGSVPGYELDDWLQAEAELVAEAVSTEGGRKSSSDGAEQPAVRRRSGRREAVPSTPSSRRV